MIKVDCSRIQNIPNDLIIENSEFLNITGSSQLDIFMRFSNERIHMEECNFWEEDVSNVVEHWRNIEKTKGKHFSIGFKDEYVVKIFLTMFRGLPGARSRKLRETRPKTFPACVVLPIGEHSEVNVYCETPKAQDAVYCETEWIVRIQIQPKGLTDSLFID